MALYRGMGVGKLEIEYSPSSAIGGNYQPFIERYGLLSTQAREMDCADLDRPYGEHPGQVVDLYHATGSNTPLHVFIHGGYWQELSSRESAVMAKPLMDYGISLGVVNYSLAPAASIDQMIDECYSALQYLLMNAAKLSLDPTNVSISGHSAGAQLIAQVLSRYQNDQILEGVKLALLISGIYDLTPLCFTSINAALGLDTDSARALSPMYDTAVFKVPCTVAVAEQDTGEFRRQAREYYNKLKHDDVPCHFLELAKRNHFDIILDLESEAQGILWEIVTAAGGRPAEGRPAKGHPAKGPI
ncbi:MAG: alpha/beta hydrolase [bacterium]